MLSNHEANGLFKQLVAVNAEMDQHMANARDVSERLTAAQGNVGGLIGFLLRGRSFAAHAEVISAVDPDATVCGGAGPLSIGDYEPRRLASADLVVVRCAVGRMSPSR